MDKRTDPYHALYDGTVLATPMGGTQLGARQNPRALAHGEGAFRYDAGARRLESLRCSSAGTYRILQGQLLRTDEGGEGGGLIGFIRRLTHGPDSTPDHRRTPPPVEEDADFRKSFAETKQQAAYAKRVLRSRRRVDLDGALFPDFGLDRQSRRKP